MTHRHLSLCLDEIAQVVENWGGKVMHFAGDAVLAEFASVVDAVKCAMDVQHNSKERNRVLPADHALRFRIGVHLGDVIVDRNEIYG